ncbi:MAG TPA: protein kinase [Polyangiales bacterium]|jgi:serine/threonine-protein kinase|nr:protein kinase [Polyangiales bacterium]
MDAEEAALAHVGKTVADKYRLIRLLGAGGMGAVYEAEHVFTKRRVALKRMHQGISRSKIAAERFVRESQAPSSIGHPGIVQVLDGGFEADGSLYLVLELLDGVSMSDAVDEDALEPPGVVQIGVELLEALAAAHEKGFVHRDIKPDNIFLAHDGRGGVVVKLLDFGIASVRDTEGDVKLTKTGAVLGTPLYMSPEQAKGARVDSRSDLWSVGAMLYRALAGVAPYQGDTYNALIVSIVTKEHLPLSEIRDSLPRSLVEVVERALKKNADERYQTASEMAEALRNVRFTEPGAEPGTPRSQRPPSMPPYSSIRPAGSEPRTVDTAPTPAATVASGKRAKLAHDQQQLKAAAVPAAAPRPQAQPAQPPRPVFVTRDLEPETSPLAKVLMVTGVCLLVLLGAAWWSASRRSQHSYDAALANGPPPPSAAASSPAQPAQPTEPVQPEPSAAKYPEPSATATNNANTNPTAQANANTGNPQPSDPNDPNAAAAHAPEGLPSQALSVVLAQHQAEMQKCLEEAVVAQMMAGSDAKPQPIRLDVELHVTPSGAVSDASVDGQAPPQLVPCVRSRLLELQFPRAEAPTIFRYPLVLSPQVVGR